MFIIWGTKVVRKKLGQIADYCFMCRSVKPFELREIRSVGHLYYIPLGRRETLGHTKACLDCGTLLDADGDDLDSRVAHRRPNLDDLLANASPGLQSRLQLREQFDLDVKRGTMDPSLRGHLILEPLIYANSLMAQRVGTLQLDRSSGPALALTFAVPVAVILLIPRLFDHDTFAIIVLAIAGGIPAIVTIALMISDGRRFASRTLLPKIKRSLLPMNPSDDELDEAFERLRAANAPLPKYLTPEAVSLALAQSDEFDMGLA